MRLSIRLSRLREDPAEHREVLRQRGHLLQALRAVRRLAVRLPPVPELVRATARSEIDWAATPGVTALS